MYRNEEITHGKLVRALDRGGMIVKVGEERPLTYEEAIAEDGGPFGYGRIVAGTQGKLILRLGESDQ